MRLIVALLACIWLSAVWGVLGAHQAEEPFIGWAGESYQPNSEHGKVRNHADVLYHPGACIHTLTELVCGHSLPVQAADGKQKWCASSRTSYVQGPPLWRCNVKHIQQQHLFDWRLQRNN